MLYTDGCCCEAAAEMFRIVCPSVRRSEADSHRRHITVTSRRKETDSVRRTILMIPYDVGFYPLIYKGEVSGPGSLIETLINIKNPGGGSPVRVRVLMGRWLGGHAGSNPLWILRRRPLSLSAGSETTRRSWPGPDPVLTRSCQFFCCRQDVMETTSVSCRCSSSVLLFTRTFVNVFWLNVKVHPADLDPPHLHLQNKTSFTPF